MFGSIIAYGINTQLFHQSGVHNNGKMIGLLRSDVTRFATYFYAMMRLVRLHDPLLATIRQAIFSDLNLDDRFRSSIMDIENKNFWKDLCTLLISVYPIQDS